MRVKKVEALGNRDGTCGASKRGKIVSGIGHAYAVQGAGKKISNNSIPDRISGKTIRRCLQAMDESCVVSARSLKRPSPFWSSNVEVPNRKVRKVSEIGREGDISQIRSGHSSFRWKMVDEVAIPQYLLEELHMPGMNQTLERYSDRVMEERYLLMRERNCGTNGSDIASVGSCSVSDSPRRPSRHILVSKKACVDTCGSDAESFCCREDDEEEECSHSLEEDVATRIHRLELQAYRCTLEALYTSGPLSWEREALLTNLRMSLHVSNDEHLLELRNLVSAKRTL